MDSAQEFEKMVGKIVTKGQNGDVQILTDSSVGSGVRECVKLKILT
jgi:hypothetical protein